MNLKTILGVAAVAFVVWFIIEQPTAASHLVHNIGTFLVSAWDGIAHFFSTTI